MAKKRLSSTDLSSMNFERMIDETVEPRGVIVAVVPDGKLGLRAIVEGRGGKFLSTAAVCELRSVEAKLRSSYLFTGVLIAACGSIRSALGLVY